MTKTLRGTSNDSQYFNVEVDSMIWFHLAKLKNLAALRRQLRRETGRPVVEQVLVILLGEAGANEPESQAILAKVADVNRS